MDMLPEHDRKITLRNINKGHPYQVEGLSCNDCANCRKGGKCIGLPSVTGITGKYIEADLYGAGHRAALDSVFGRYTNRFKDEVTDDGWITDLIRTDGTPAADELVRYRQEVEEMPTPGSIARDFGTGVHKTLEEWLKAYQNNEMPFIEDEYMEQAAPIVDWLHRHECEILDVEALVYHPTLLYGGQIDCVARRGNSILVCDWKSGKGIYKNAAAQVAAYALAYTAITGVKVDEGWVLRSGKDGFEAKRIADLDVAGWLFVNLHSVKENWNKIEWIEEA